MDTLHFQGRGDAYLEWAVASGFAWLAASPGDTDTVGLLVDEGADACHAIAVHRASRTGLRHTPGALPAHWAWAELAHAVAMARFEHRVPLQWTERPREVVLGLIDAGIGSAWLVDWARSHPLREVFHWDLDGASAAQPLPRVSHGAHVLSWLAGQPPYPGQPFDSDHASHCPLMLVNLPRDAVEDPSGRWLGHHLIEGLDHMLGQALAIAAQHLVVNISWGPQTGPHDGSSLLERALVQRIEAAQAQRLRLDIVLAAGNSRESRAHARFDAADGCADLGWVVPPAGRSPGFLELWWPPGSDIRRVRVNATAPNGEALALAGEGVVSRQTAHGVVVAPPGPGADRRPMALLALNPTGAPRLAAPHGRWRIAVEGIPGTPGTVHAYLARQTANLGGRYRGPDSHLDDPGLDQQPCRHHPGPPTQGALVTRQGTLSGLATAMHPHLHVATGAIQSTGEPARYASEGPAVGGGVVRPDWALPTDETPLLRGVLGAGSRPGSVVRLAGTSMAAPQLARLLLHGLPALPPAQAWHPRTGHGVAAPGWTSRQRA